MYRNKMIGFLFGFALGFLFMLNVTYPTYSLSQILFCIFFYINYGTCKEVEKEIGNSETASP